LTKERGEEAVEETGEVNGGITRVENVGLMDR
jgi:hypothetical protein